MTFHATYDYAIQCVWFLIWHEKLYECNKVDAKYKKVVFRKKIPVLAQHVWAINIACLLKGLSSQWMVLACVKECYDSST